MRLLSTFGSIATLLGLVASQATITTPPILISCQPAQLTIAGGTPPYFIAVIPAGQVGAQPIETLPQVAAAGPVTWTCNIAAGTNVSFSLTVSSSNSDVSQRTDIDGCPLFSAGRNGCDRVQLGRRRLARYDDCLPRARVRTCRARRASVHAGLAARGSLRHPSGVQPGQDRRDEEEADLD